MSRSLLLSLLLATPSAAWEPLPPTAKQRQAAEAAAERLGIRHTTVHTPEGELPVFYPKPEHLAVLAPLRFRCQVGLAHQAVKEEHLKALARHPGIVSLTLHNTAVADACLPALARLPSLRTLDLSNTRVTDAGLATLAKLPALRSLDLNRTKVTAGGLRNLKGARLTSLVPPRAASTDEGFRAFLDASGDLESLHLFFDWPLLTDAGLAGLKRRTTLRRLSLHGKRLGPGFEEALPTLIGLRWLNLTSSSATDATLRRAGKLPQLQELLLGRTRVTDAGMKHLAGMPRLQRVELRHTAVGDGGLKHLAGKKGLREVDLYGARVTDGGLKHLATLPDLRALHLDETRVSVKGLWALAPGRLDDLTIPRQLRGDAALAAYLTALPGPESLRLHWNLTDAGLAELPNHPGLRASLRTLHLQGTFTDRGLTHLTGLRKVRSLQLWSANYPPEGLRHLKALPELERLGLPPTVGDAHLKVVGGLAGLRWLAVHRAPVSDAGMKELARLPRLGTLSLRETNVGDDGLLALAGVKSLRWIDITYSAVTYEGARAFQRRRPECELPEGE